MTEFLLNPVVGVFRQCRKCKAYKTLGAYSNRTHRKVCNACSKRESLGVTRRYVGGANRTLRITQAGRALLREWEREQQSA